MRSLKITLITEGYLVHRAKKTHFEETIPADKHFTHGHTFNKEAKLSLIHI